MSRLKKGVKKTIIGVAGGFLVLLGLVMVPYPGPGWLVVFAGLAILATEFEFAATVLDFTKGKYNAWLAWLMRQNIWVRMLILAATGMVVLISLWFFNAFGLINSWFNIGLDWVDSPLTW